MATLESQSTRTLFDRQQDFLVKIWKNVANEFDAFDIETHIDSYNVKCSATIETDQGAFVFSAIRSMKSSSSGLALCRSAYFEELLCTFELDYARPSYSLERRSFFKALFYRNLPRISYGRASFLIDSHDPKEFMTILKSTPKSVVRKLQYLRCKSGKGECRTFVFPKSEKELRSWFHLCMIMSRLK
ncbi:MAG: hypothetical protein ACPGTP_06990 [Bacteroidia bacterium]